jgi:hypothetical protein
MVRTGLLGVGTTTDVNCPRCRFRYAKRNKVVMIDDGYEQIYTDIEPFFSLPTSVLQSRAHALANDINLPHYINSFTLSVKSGQSSLSGPEKLGSRAEDASDMLSEFVSEMPDMEVTFSGGDLPAVVVSGEARERHLEFAREGICECSISSLHRHH